MADNTIPNILNEQVSFIQHQLPGLTAGDFQLQVQQQVLESDGKPLSGQAYSSTYTFGVSGDRFALSSPAKLSSVFPADNATGKFSNVLPSVVFTQPTFPWTRYPTTNPPVTTPPPGTDVDADVPTWLWVMLLDQDDVDQCQQQGLTLDLSVATRTVADLFPPAALVNTYNPETQKPYTSTLGDNYSYFNGATNVNGLEPGQNLADSVQTVDVPLSLLWSMAPTVQDLAMMAHVRKVSLINQNTTSGVSGPGEPLGTFSVVVGNRLPGDGTRNSAFLVSLEGMQPMLPTSADGGKPTGSTLDGTKMVRLAVFTSWTFYSKGQSADFVKQMLRLNGRTLDGPPATNTNLRLTYAGNNPVVRAAVNMGYAPLNETLRTAENAVSWYRGPLVPYAVPNGKLNTPIPSPDAAMIFDPTTGMLDVSYATAWTIGRMVALQDTAFSVAYYNWRRTLEQQVHHNVETQLIEGSMGKALSQTPHHLKAAATADGGTKASLRRRTLLALNPKR